MSSGASVSLTWKAAPLHQMEMRQLEKLESKSLHPSLCPLLCTLLCLRSSSSSSIFHVLLCTFSNLYLLFFIFSSQLAKHKLYNSRVFLFFSFPFSTSSVRGFQDGKLNLQTYERQHTWSVRLFRDMREGPVVYKVIIKQLEVLY